MLQNFIFTLLATIVAFIPLFGSSVAPQTARVSLFGCYEETLDYRELTGRSHSYPDPFYGVDLTVLVTSPSGRRFPWWGFFDGDGEGGQKGNIWKIRLMPDELGTWTFDWTFDDASASGRSEFEAVDSKTMPAKPGPLRHDRRLPQWLLSADGSRHVFLNMYTRWRSTGYEPYLDSKAVVREVQSFGFDAMPIWSTVWFKDEPMDDRNPMIFLELESYIPRLAGWHLLEKGIYRAAYDLELYLYQWGGFYGGNKLYSLHEESLEKQNRVIRYWLSREAAFYMLLYNIGFELQEYVEVPEWPVERARFVKSIDPWDHLLTGHELNEFSYAEYPVIDFSAIQVNGDFNELAEEIWSSPSRPHVHCSECIWNAPWGPDYDETSRRTGLWQGLMGGMSFNLYARDNQWGLEAFAHANGFLKSGLRWWEMSPQNNLVTKGQALVLAQPGVQYLVYSQSDSSFGLTLEKGSYRRRWFNPVDGKYGRWIDGGRIEAGAHLFSKPDPSEWVLQMEILPLSSETNSHPPEEKD